MKTSASFYKPAESLRGEWAASVALGLSGIVGIVFALLAMTDFVNHKAGIVASLENPVAAPPAPALASNAATNPAGAGVLLEDPRAGAGTNGAVVPGAGATVSRPSIRG
jgi:hypothetical protein